MFNTSIQYSRSGCDIKLINKEDGIYIKKISSSTSYNSRFSLQLTKQKNFIPVFNFNAPKITNIILNQNSNLIEGEMEYIHGKIFLTMLEEYSTNYINFISESLIKYFDYIINSSITYIHPGKDIHNKLLNILEHKALIDFKIRLLSIFSSLPNECIPLGYCHGDFTLANMLFTSNKIYLLDFLDSYLESPIIDMVKIRQDTKHLWSLLLLQNADIVNRGTIILNKLDKLLVDYFSKHQWYIKWEYYFELINLLRILPYLTNQTEISYIKSNIKILMEQSKCI